MSISSEAAEIIGLQALSWLVAEEDLLPVFLGSTGASEADMRASANDPAFLGGVLDFILMDDAWVIACAQAISVAPERLQEARVSLPGAQQVHWT